MHAAHAMWEPVITPYFSPWSSVEFCHFFGAECGANQLHNQLIPLSFLWLLQPRAVFFFTIQGEVICQADCVVRMVTLQTKFELAHNLRFCVSGLDHS